MSAEPVMAARMPAESTVSAEPVMPGETVPQAAVNKVAAVKEVPPMNEVSAINEVATEPEIERAIVWLEGVSVIPAIGGFHGAVGQREANADEERHGHQSCAAGHCSWSWLPREGFRDLRAEARSGSRDDGAMGCAQPADEAR
jgi:hypothetical protein